MKEYKVVTTQFVTKEEIDDVVTTALEGGITYWCGEVRVKKRPGGKKYTYASDALTRGHHLAIYDFEEDNWHTLTLEGFIKALGDMKFDFDDYDASDADAVVQKALFGEVIYG